MLQLFRFKSTIKVLLGIGILQAFLFAGLAGITPASGADPDSSPDGKGMPRIEVDRELVNYGQVPIEQRVEHRTIIRNVGDAPLVLGNICPNPEHKNWIHTRVLEGCWPPHVVVSSTTIMPGEEAVAVASFTMHEGMEGPHLIVLPLITNDPREPHKFVKILVDFVNPNAGSDAKSDASTDK